MTDELKAVAERAEDLNSGVWFRSAVSGLWYRNAGSAGAVSAVAVDGVRFHGEQPPADDETPVDESWLKHVGFTCDRDACDMGVEWSLEAMLIEQGDRLMVASQEPHEVVLRGTTRGDVRKLASALGIELKENAT